jgi:uncharacterized protein YjiS (DUF1127 family)
MSREDLMPEPHDQPPYRTIARRDAQRGWREATRAISALLGEKATVQAWELLQSVGLDARGVSGPRLQKTVGLSRAGIHRAAARLGISGDGLGLLVGETDPDDPRRMVYRLTGKGRRAIEDMIATAIDKPADWDPEEGDIVRVQAVDENDRALFVSYGVDPDRAFVFGCRPWRAVAHWMSDREDMSPEKNLRASPFGGYAATFGNDSTELSFYVRFSDALDPSTRSDRSRITTKRS